jgi:hypothetical protein
VGAVQDTSEESAAGSRREPGLKADPGGKDAPAPTWDAPGRSVPSPAGGGVRDPHWAPEPKPKPSAQPTGTGGDVPPRIPDWKPSAPSTSTPEVHWEHSSQGGLPARPVHLSSGRARGRGPGRRNRLVAATVVLVCLLVAAVAIALALPHSTTTTGSSTSTTTGIITTSPGTATPPASTDHQSPQTAVSGAQAATTKALSQLRAISGFPTTTNVAVVINPYAYALQLYESFLAQSAVPAAAWSDKVSADTQMSQDLRFLNTINGLPSLRLGAYMVRFSAVTSQLQSTLSTLAADLHASKS